MPGIRKRHHVYVISDEIHQNVITKSHEHAIVTTTGVYDGMLIILTAGTKTFSLTACQNSVPVILDQGLQDRYDQYLKRLWISGGNVFGYATVQNTYEKERDWLEQVLDIVEVNYRYMKNAFLKTLVGAWISELRGTYLIWIGLGRYIKSGDVEHVIQDKYGLAVDYGGWFDGGGYGGFIRVDPVIGRESIGLTTQNIIRALRHV